MSMVNGEIREGNTLINPLNTGLQEIESDPVEYEKSNVLEFFEKFAFFERNADKISGKRSQIKLQQLFNEIYK